jgi:CheY-like chemotaxis protein
MPLNHDILTSSVVTISYLYFSMIRNRPNPLRLLIADRHDDLQTTKDCFIGNNLPVLITEVYNAQMLMEYLKTYTKELPQLILLDIYLPGDKGLEALAEIKKNDNFRKIPVIIFSFSNAAEDIEKSYELGASCFVSKPATMDEWCDKINKIGRFWIECGRVPL